MTTHFSASMMRLLLYNSGLLAKSPMRKPELEFLYNSFSVSVLGCPKDIFVLDLPALFRSSLHDLVAF
jgi:hypothetical protein